MHILSRETDNCPSWINGRDRMTVENISWSHSTKQWCRVRRRSSLWRPDYQSEAHSTEPPRPTEPDQTTCRQQTFYKLTKSTITSSFFPNEVKTTLGGIHLTQKRQQTGQNMTNATVSSHNVQHYNEQCYNYRLPIISSNESTDSTGGSIISECRLGKWPWMWLKIVSFNP